MQYKQDRNMKKKRKNKKIKKRKEKKKKEKGRRQNFVEVEATKKAESNVVFIEYKDWYL